jgi:hypothetical protein
MISIHIRPSDSHLSISENEMTTGGTNNGQSARNANRISTKCAKTIDRIRQILSALQANLLNNSRATTDQTPLPRVKSSSSTRMTSDSLRSKASVPRTYSVSSTFAPSNIKNALCAYKSSGNLSSSSRSTVNVESEILRIELDSLDDCEMIERERSKPRLLNSAQNINRNQQSSDDDELKSRSTTSRLPASIRERSSQVTVSFLPLATHFQITLSSRFRRQ